MVKFCLLLATLVLVHAPGALSASPPDLTRVPLTFCRNAQEIASSTAGCQANDNFTKAASACFDQLNELEATLGKEAKAISESGAASQRAQVGTGQSEYAFSGIALKYLQGVAALAIAQLKEYSRYLNLPPDAPGAVHAERLRAANETPCFSDSQKRLAEVVRALESKLATYKEGGAQSSAYQRKLRSAGTDFGSLTGSAKKGSKLPAATAAAKDAAKPASRSSITGVENDKKKRDKK